MKIAVTSTGTDMDSPVDSRFGRCPYLAVVDLESGQLEAVVNPFQNASGGAGIQAAQWVVGKGVGALLTGSCGPKASAVLEDADIEVISGVSGSVREAAERFKHTRRDSSTPAAAGAETDITPRGWGRRIGSGPGAGQSSGRCSSQGSRRGPGHGGRGGGRKGGGCGPGGGRERGGGLGGISRV
jgi:predicted Fe-Mo cluster-binding NifX family protein